jgi:hypothetical protein
MAKCTRCNVNDVTTIPLCDLCIQIEKNEREQQHSAQAQVAGESGKTMSNTQANKSAPKSSTFSSALRVFAAIELIVGILGAVLVVIFLIVSTVSSKNETLLLLVLVTTFQGFFFFVLLNVIAEIADTLRAILHKLSEKS